TRQREPPASDTGRYRRDRQVGSNRSRNSASSPGLVARRRKSMRSLQLLGTVLLGMLLLSGCVVRAPVAVVPARPCPEAVWVPGHYGPGGVWYAAHWRCAGGVVIR